MGLQMCFAKHLSKNMDIQVRTTNSFILFNIITKFLRLFAPCRDITQYCKKFPKNSENFEKFRNFVAILGNIATKDQKTSKFRYDIEKYRNKIYCDILTIFKSAASARNRTYLCILTHFVPI